MYSNDTKFMTLIEFVCLLNPLQSAAQSPETLKAFVFFIVVRGKIVLKSKHGVNGVEVILQRTKNRINNNSLPGLISQRCRIRPV